MLKVKDIMTKALITVSPDTEIVQATKLLLENRINGIPVTDERLRNKKNFPSLLFSHFLMD